LKGRPLGRPFHYNKEDNVRLKLCIILSFAFISTIAFAADPEQITIDKAIEIASKQAVSDGYDVSNMRMEVFLDISPRKMRYPNSEPFDEKEKLIEKYTKPFITVYFSPSSRGAHGGGICIYINSDTGEILMIERGA
jgi:hypothetical protein